MTFRSWLAVIPFSIIVACQSQAGLDADCVLPPPDVPAGTIEGASGEDEIVIATVLFAGDVTDADRDFLRSLDAEILYEWAAQPAVLIRIPGQNLEQVRNHARVHQVIESGTGEFPGC